MEDDFEMEIAQIEFENDFIWTKDFAKSCYQTMKTKNIITTQDDFDIPF